MACTTFSSTSAWDQHTIDRSLIYYQSCNATGHCTQEPLGLWQIWKMLDVRRRVECTKENNAGDYEQESRWFPGNGVRCCIDTSRWRACGGRYLRKVQGNDSGFCPGCPPCTLLGPYTKTAWCGPDFHKPKKQNGQPAWAGRTKRSWRGKDADAGGTGKVPYGS